MSPEEFLREFGGLAETEGGIGQLRALVVEMAVTGRLEGCQFTGTPRTLRETVPLIQTGPFGSLLHKSDYISGGTPLINPTNLVNGTIVPDATKAVSDETLDRLSLYRVATGDVMLARRGEMGRTAVVTKTEDGWLCGTGSMFLRSPEGISSTYLALWLGSPGVRLRLTGGAVGTTMSNLNQRILNGLEIIVPPLPEQKRIVEKVDQLMALCDELEAKQKQKREKSVSFNKAALHAIIHAPDKSQFKSSWSRVQDHFEVLYELPENVKELRQTILQLAVMGKLVRQEEGDESAASLLGRIADERSALLEANLPNESEAKVQLRKQSGQSLPGDLGGLPKGWEWATLMQVSHLVVDCHNKTAPYAGQGVRLVRTTNVRNGQLNFTEPKFVTEETYDRWAARCPPQERDLLITREAPMGEVCIIPKGMRLCMGQRMMLIRLVPETIVPEYLLYSIMAPDFMERVQDKPVGATVQHLRVGGVESSLVPVPPRPEQARIVHKVDQLMALCDELEAKLAQHREHGQRLMQAVVESLVA